MSKRKGKGRNLNGLLLFDKSSGESSNHALQKVKYQFNAAKAGHTGTLDPLATGLLVICFGRATKISDYLLSADKQYRVTFKLGVKTTTGDSDGEVLEVSDASCVTEKQIKQAAIKFMGNIEQIPPMVSALKYQGERLYELARKGIVVERKPRSVCIHRLDFIDQYEEQITMHVTCSKGTYIRTLVEDLGEYVGCGAHITSLRRTSLGPFVEPVMHTMCEIKKIAEMGESALDKLVLGTDAAFKEYPKISVDNETKMDLQHGRAIQLPELSQHGKVRIYDEEKQFYGIASIKEDGRTVVKRMN